MPKKQTKAVAPTVRLRRSKPLANPINDNEEQFLTDEEQLLVDSEEDDVVQEEKPKKKVAATHKPRAPRKPKAPAIDLVAERKNFDDYIQSERAKLKAEHEALINATKAEVKADRKTVSNTREDRLRLMSGINF
jgi:hypothetical protein